MDLRINSWNIPLKDKKYCLFDLDTHQFARTRKGKIRVFANLPSARGTRSRILRGIQTHYTKAPYEVTIKKGTIGLHGHDSAGKHWSSWHGSIKFTCTHCGATITHGWVRVEGQGSELSYFCSEHINVVYEK